MSEQKANPLCQMNLTLKGVTADIEALPKIRRRAFRVVHRLLQYSFNETKARLAEALGYKNAETMRADTEALADIIVQVLRAFGESNVHGFGYEDDSDTPPPDIPAWLELERGKWRRFELTAEDFTQIAELNAIIERHGLSRRELAVITASLRIRPEFTLADFSPNQSEANLSGYATVDLATELKRRDGVESVCLEPYASATMKMEGPATVLKVFV